MKRKFIPNTCYSYVLDINPRKTNAKLILRREMYRSQAKLSVKRLLLMLQQIPIFRAYDKVNPLLTRNAFLRTKSICW